MSRPLRQASQLARLARYSARPAFRRGLRPSATVRSNPPVFSATQGGIRPRYYSSQPPEPDNNSKPETGKKKDGAKDEKKDADSKEGRGEAEAPKKELPPLPDGWVRLAPEEAAKLDDFLNFLPDSQRVTHKDTVGILEETGVPQEMRELIKKMLRKESLTLMEKGRIMRYLFQVSDRASTLQNNNQSKYDFFDRKSKKRSDEDDPEAKAGQDQPKNEKGGKGDKGEKGQKGEPPRSGGTKLAADLIPTVLAFATVYWLSETFSGASEPEITWQEVRRSFLDKGLVKKMVVIDGSRVRVELHADAVQPTDSGAPGRRFYSFSIGSVESFENRLEEAQDDLGIPPAQRIPVSYASGSSTLGHIFMAFGPTLLFIALIIWTQRSMSGRIGGGGGGGGGIFNFGKSKAKKFNAESAVKVKFADVAGMEEAKTEIMEFVSFLKQPEKFEKLGAKIPRGAILSGPPGTGKTLLAKATAGESGVPFFSVSGSEFVEMFVGVGSSRVRDLFAEGRKNAPCILFIDEIDAIGRARQDGGQRFGGNDEREATLNQILTEMDGFNSREQVVVLAGTNRADVLDKALMRPGRFDRHIYIDRPTTKGREEIFQVYLKKIVTKEDISHLVGRLATLTPGFSGADIANVVNEAALIAARYSAADVKMTHFEQAIERVIGGLERKSLVLRPEEKKTVAYHEAGHAICGWFLKDADPLLKVSIIPRGQGALGYAQYLPQDAYLMNTNQLMDRMAMTMGGRVSEELHFPTVTTGASDDFKKVSQMARAMVTQWGMSDKVGPMHFDTDPNQMQKPFAEATAQDIDHEVHRIVEQAYQRCRDLLTAKKEQVGLLAEELLKKEMLVRDDMVRILGKRPFGENEDFEKYFGGGKGESNPPPFPGETDTPPEPPSPSPAFRRALLPEDGQDGGQTRQ